MRADRALRDLGAGGWREHMRYLRGVHGRNTARVISTALGVNLEAGRRWMAGAGLLTSRSATPSIANREALRNLVAATKLLSGPTRPGNRVRVRSSSKAQDGAPRRVQDMTGAIPSRRMRTVATYVMAGRYEMAGELFDEVVMDAYGGLGGSLFDCDYGTDLRIGE